MKTNKFLIFNFKFLIPFFALWAMNVQAVTVEQVAGTYQGTLSIDDEPYPNEKIYILPGTEAGRITFVLPDFRYNGAPLGDIVLVNVGMSNSGELTIDETSLYIKAIRARATISSTGSTLSVTSAQIGLEIGVAAVPMPIPVTFSGQKQTSANYAITNGGFEGAWTSHEPQGWHSFGTATGDYASFVTGNTGQFQQSSDTRPGSTGSHSALLQSKTVLGVSANGNCTNGRINAGSMSATDASGNYSFSEPGSSYTTPFVGQPDSLVFWAKYLPGGGSIEDASNQASAHAVLTTNARYQDPESSDYSTVKIGEATARFSATTELGWRRVSVPFSYTSVDPKQMAYMLITFSTNKTPGGGNSTKKSPDKLYIDDAEMVYNYGLKSLTMDGQAVSFTQGVATLSQTYSDSEYSAVVTTDGRAAKSFIGYDAETYSMYVYVVADNYSQSGDYTVYRVQMTVPEVPVTDTYYSYEATTCDNAAYSDELFQELTEAGTYVDTIPNMQGGDSIVTLTLRVLPTYRMEETLYRTEIDTIWRGQAISGLAQQAEPYLYYDVLEAANGCDSTYVLRLYISDIPVTYGVYEAQMCEGESVTYEGVTYSEAYEGDIHVAKKNQYGGDSIVHLTVTVLPNYTIDEYKTIHEGAQESWEGWNLSTMPVGEMTLDAWYYTEQDCDSTLILHLTVLPKQLETGVGDVQSTNVQCTKVVIDGQMYIRRGEELFDPIGRKIRK
jgi:hypothetical protein